MTALTARRTRLRFELLEDRAVPATLFVDDDLLQFPKAKYQSIQAAVDAADSGDQIIVAPGTYREQVRFDADKDNITLRSKTPYAAVIEAPKELTDELAIVTVAGADKVTIRGFTITGPATTANNLVYGVAVVGGSATIRDNVITAIRNDPLDGGQLGVGVLVFGDGGSASARILDNVISYYQKGGVVVFGADANASIQGNTVVGAGPTDTNAQNGVQVSDGASAFVADNSITGNDYTGAADTFGTGILVDIAGQVTLSRNRVFGNENGVVVTNTRGVIVTGNRVYGNSADGIDLVGVGYGVVANNTVEKNGVDGVVLQDTSNTLVFNNTIRRNGGDGLVLTDGSAKNVIFQNTLRQNVGFDAFDDTTGPLTGGTANFWFKNNIGTKNRSGLQ